MEKKVISFLLIFFLFVVNISASEVDLVSEKYILYNMNDNTVLMEKDSHEETSMASLTKIMTTIIAIENIEDYDEKVTITKDMLKGIAWDVSVAGFKVGDRVTYDDLLYGAMLPSGADAVNALAISISGSLDDFIKLMNKKVEELKLENTNFENVTGLYGSKHYSSAYDMAQILIYALENEKFLDIFDTATYTSTNNIKMKSSLQGYNRLSNSDISHITGSKTGYIKKAGYCLASTATIENVDYLFVSLNAFSDDAPHIKDAVKTYKYFSDTYGYENIVDTTDVVVTLPTKYAKEDKVEVHSSESMESYIEKDVDKKEDITYVYDGIEEISYFTKSGTKIGNVKIMYKDKVLNSFDLIYAEELSLSIWLLLWGYKYYIIGLLLLIVLLVLIKKKKRRRHKY